MQVLMVRIQVIYKFVVNKFSYLSQRGRQFQIHIDRFWRARLARYWSMGKIYRHVNQRPEVSPCSLYYRNHNRLHERSCELAMILSSLYTDRTGLVNAQKIQGRILDSYCMRETLAHLLAWKAEKVLFVLPLAREQPTITTLK